MLEKVEVGKQRLERYGSSAEDEAVAEKATEIWACVRYDPELTDPDQLVAAVERAGFRAGETSRRSGAGLPGDP